MSKTPKIDDTNAKAGSHASEQTSEARRRLLKIGAYVPPAIVGMAIIGSMPGTAHAKKPGSCMPSACKPCVDIGDGKDDKDKDHGDKENEHECKKAQKEMERKDD